MNTPETGMILSAVTVNRESFDGESVEVTIRGETRRLPALVSPSDASSLYVPRGLFGMYQTGKARWPANATVRKSAQTGADVVDVVFGFDSRSRKHSVRPDVYFRD
jgi:hypothetical protein